MISTLIVLRSCLKGKYEDNLRSIKLLEKLLIENKIDPANIIRNLKTDRKNRSPFSPCVCVCACESVYNVGWVWV